MHQGIEKPSVQARLFVVNPRPTGAFVYDWPLRRSVHGAARANRSDLALQAKSLIPLDDADGRQRRSQA